VADKGRPSGRPTTQQKALSVRPYVYELRRLRADAEWDRYHAIRKLSLFETYHPWIPYDRYHPDEHHPDNHPLGFFRDGEMVGTIRIDLKPDGRAIFRMVAIIDGKRGQHLGSRLLRTAEAYAEGSGAAAACLNAVRPALGFYVRHGYTPLQWSGCTSSRESVPLTKPLRRAGFQPTAVYATTRRM
jgi:GNAT superfamily N-acetyltransferase